jgi:hypothetical protein
LLEKRVGLESSEFPSPLRIRTPVALTLSMSLLLCTSEIALPEDAESVIIGGLRVVLATA